MTVAGNCIEINNERHKLKIRTKGLKKKKRNPKSYYYWMVGEQPKRKKRLPQINKANHIRRMHTPKSELIVAAEKFESEPAPKGSRGSR